MTGLVARLLFPISLVIGVSLWAKGYAAAGGGFSAGVVAGLGAVVQYVCLARGRVRPAVGARAAGGLLVAGLLVGLLLLLGPALAGAPPVTHLPAPGEEVVRVGVLELHTSVLFDLGVGLVSYGAVVITFDRLFPVFREELS